MPLPKKEILADGIDLFGTHIKNGYRFGVNLEVARRALEIGKAAEHLVCADLILQGYKAFLTGQGLAYDVVAEASGKLIKIQVKSTLNKRPIPQRRREAPEGYLFHVRRAGHRSMRRIGNDEFDLLALVALDIRTVAYMPIDGSVRQSIHLRCPGLPAARYGGFVRRTIDQYPFSEAMEALCPSPKK